MLNRLRDKIQSLTRVQNKILLATLFFLNIGIWLFLIFSIILLFRTTQPLPMVEEKPFLEQEQRIIEKQLRELEGLREEAHPLTEKEIKAQLKELEKLRQKRKLLSQEEIQKQLEELEKLR